MPAWTCRGHDIENLVIEPCAKNRHSKLFNKLFKWRHSRQKLTLDGARDYLYQISFCHCKVRTK